MTVGVHNAEPAQAAVACYGYIHNHANSTRTIRVQTRLEQATLNPGNTFYGHYANPAWVRVTISAGRHAVREGAFSRIGKT